MKWISETWIGGFIVGALFGALVVFTFANKSDWNDSRVPIEHAR